MVPRPFKFISDPDFLNCIYCCVVTVEMTKGSSPSPNTGLPVHAPSTTEDAPDHAPSGHALAQGHAPRSPPTDHPGERGQLPT